MIRQSDREHLLDGVANIKPDLPAGCRACLAAAGLHPVGDEGIDMRRQFVPPCRSLARRECAEPDQDRDSPKHVARCIAMLGEPADVPLDRLTDPGCPNAVNRIRADKVPLQHNNLHSMLNG